MSNKYDREYKESISLFKDPKFSRKAWQNLGIAIASQPPMKPITTYDKEGNPTRDSLIEEYTYSKLQEDLKKLGTEGREMTEIEMILHCQMIKARTDTSAAIFIRDTLGAKPVDESKLNAQVTNPYETLTDEELELLAEHRAKKEKE